MLVCALVILLLTVVGCSPAPAAATEPAKTATREAPTQMATAAVTAAPTATTAAPPATEQSGLSPRSPAAIEQVVKSFIACGNPQEYTVHERYDTNIVVLEVVRGEEAWDLIKAASSSNKPADAGFEYVLARIRIEYYARTLPGSCGHELEAEQFAAYSTDGKKYVSATVVPPTPELSGTLFSGDTREGWLAFQVPEDDRTPLLAFKPWTSQAISAVSLWFQLY